MDLSFDGGRTFFAAKSFEFLGVCSKGFYCNIDPSTLNVGAKLECPKGAYCPSVVTLGTEIAYNQNEIMCGFGYYSDVLGNIACTICPKGTYCP